MNTVNTNPISFIFLHSLLACAFIAFSFLLTATEKKEHKETAESMVIVKFAQLDDTKLLENMVKVYGISEIEAENIARVPFHCAILTDERTALAWLYGNRSHELGSLHSEVDFQFDTPIHVAAKKGYADLVDCLLALKADPNDKCGKGYSLPLMHMAVMSNQANVIDRILQYHPIDINEQNGMLQSAPLVTACQLGNVEAARVLLDHGADTGRADVSGETALMKVAVFENMLKSKKKSAEIFALLLCSGADWQRRNGLCRTALDLAQTQSCGEAETILENPTKFLSTQVSRFVAQGLGKGVHRQKGASIFRQLEQRSFGVTQQLKRLKPLPLADSILPFKPRAEKPQDNPLGREVPRITLYMSERSA